MAVAHLHAQVISRGSGHSAVAKAAYNARASLSADREGETYDYTRHRSKCIFEGIFAPKDAPEWTQDRAKLWNHVEAFETHRRAELAREVEISLPHELTPEQNRWLLQDWIKENVTRKGLIADAAIHAPDPRGNALNVHAHVLIVMRKLDGSEFERTKERFDTYSEKQKAKEADLTKMRASWEKLANKHLERHGHEARIDMGRTLNAEPTIHLGKTASRMERQGFATERGDHNREIETSNDNRREMAAAEAERKTLAELQTQQFEKVRQRTREIAEIEAENTPQHRQARPRQAQTVDQVAEPAKAPPELDRNAGDLARALEALALTDPLRFAAAASVARETAYRPTIPGYAPPSPAMPLEVSRPTSAAAPKQQQEPTRATAEPVRQVRTNGLSLSFTIPGKQQQPQEPAREPQARRAVSRGTDLPARVREAPQRPSYEVEKPIPAPERERTREREVPTGPGWREKAIQAGRSMLAQFGNRLDRGIETWRSRQQPEPTRQRVEPRLVKAPMSDPQPVRERTPEAPIATAQKVMQPVQYRLGPQPMPRMAQSNRPAQQHQGRAAPMRPALRLIEHGPAKSENTRRQEQADRLKQIEAEKEQRQAERREEWEKRIALQNDTRDLERKARGFWDDDIEAGRKIIEARNEGDENIQDCENDGSRERGGPGF